MAVIGFGTLGRAQTVYVVDRFDPSGTGGNNYASGQITNVWGNWFGSAFSNLVWDSASDASNNPASGSMKVTVNFNGQGSIPNQFEVYDGFNGISPALNGLQYTNFQCDVRFAPGSATVTNGGVAIFGHLQFGTAVGSSQDYFGSVDVPASKTNWVHVSINLDATTDTNLQNISDVLIHIYGPYYSPGLSGTSILWVDNIQFVGATPVSTNCVVDWNDVHQRIDGFGASSAWRGSWTTNQADMFFSTNTGVGLSLLRNHITAASSTSASATPTTSEWNIMQMAQARGALVWSAPWTPANGFKSSNTANGGNYLGSGANATNLAYASQLANYVLSMKSSYGVNLYAISVQNEPDYNTTSWESCVWTGSQIHDFVTNLHNALVANGVGSTKIIIPESMNWSNSSNAGLYTNSLGDANVAPYVSVIANHNYVGNNSVGDTTTPAALTTYGKPVWETEVSTTSSYDGSINNAMYWALRIHLFLTVPQASAWHYWWLIPTGSDNSGLTDSNGTPAKRMYVLGQYSRFVRPGYCRIGVNNNTGTVLISAYRDTNSASFAIVAANTSNTTIDETFNLTNFTAVSVTPWITSSTLSLSNQPVRTVSNSSFTYTLPAMSVVTFVGQSTSNSAPTDISLLNSTVPENQPAGTAVGTFSTTDPDSGNTFTYTLVSGTGSTNNASFTISSNSLQTAAVFDYEVKNSYSIRVRSTDQGGLSFEKAFTITVVDTNEAPTDISLSNAAVPENQPTNTVVGTFSTTDPDSGNTFTYTLVSGAGSSNNASFTISSNALLTAVVFDYETQNSYSIRVRSTDQGGLSFEKAFTITVTDVNEPPTDVSLSNSSVMENQPSGTVVGTLSTTDPDATNTFTYSLVSGDGSTNNGSFTITNDTLYAAVTFDYEVKNSYSIRVQSTDQGSLWFEKVFTITVTDVNETPNTPANLSPADGATNQSLTLTLQASAFTDPDAGDSHAASQWLIRLAADNSIIFDSGTNSTDKTSFAVPLGLLDCGMIYNWQVRYQDNLGEWSGYSTTTSFSTLGPSLSVTGQGGNVVLSWPTNATGFSLEYTTSLPSTDWISALPPPVVIGNQNVVTNATTNGSSFYRLNRP